MNVRLVKWGQLGFAYKLAVLAERGRGRCGGLGGSVALSERGSCRESIAPSPAGGARPGAAPGAASRGRRRPRFEAAARRGLRPLPGAAPGIPGMDGRRDGGSRGVRPLGTLLPITGFPLTARYDVPSAAQPEERLRSAQTLNPH